MLGHNVLNELQGLGRVADVDLHGIAFAAELADLLCYGSQLIKFSGCDDNSGSEAIMMFIGNKDIAVFIISSRPQAYCLGKRLSLTWPSREQCSDRYLIPKK